MATRTDTGPRTPVVPVTPARAKQPPTVYNIPAGIAAPAGAPATSTPAGAPGTPTSPITQPLVGAGTGETVASGTEAIQAILNLIDLGSATGNDGQPLASSLLNAVNNSGLDPTSATDSTSVQAFVDTWLPTQTAYQTRFPGIMTQLKNGENPTSATDYIDLEDTAQGLATQYGVNYSAIFTPSAIANIVTSGQSATELASRFNTYMDEYESAPTEVQEAYNQFFGVNGTTAFAASLADPTLSDDQVKSQIEAAEIQGAGAALGLNVGQARSTQLAAMGVSYSTALSALHTVTAESGLYTPTQGEEASETGQGATEAVTANNQGIDAAMGLSAAAEQQVDQEKEERENAFKGGGGAQISEAAGGGAYGAGQAFSS